MMSRVLLLFIIYFLPIISSSFIDADYLYNTYKVRDDLLFGGIYVYEDDSLLVSFHNGTKDNQNFQVIQSGQIIHDFENPCIKINSDCKSIIHPVKSNYVFFLYTLIDEGNLFGMVANWNGKVLYE